MINNDYMQGGQPLVPSVWPHPARQETIPNWLGYADPYYAQRTELLTLQIEEQKVRVEIAKLELERLRRTP